MPPRVSDATTIVLGYTTSLISWAAGTVASHVAVGSGGGPVMSGTQWAAAWNFGQIMGGCAALAVTVLTVLKVLEHLRGKGK